MQLILDAIPEYQGLRKDVSPTRRLPIVIPNLQAAKVRAFPDQPKEML